MTVTIDDLEQGQDVKDAITITLVRQTSVEPGCYSSPVFPNQWGPSGYMPNREPVAMKGSTHD